VGLKLLQRHPDIALIWRRAIGERELAIGQDQRHRVEGGEAALRPQRRRDHLPAVEEHLAHPAVLRDAQAAALLQQGEEAHDRRQADAFHRAAEVGHESALLSLPASPAGFCRGPGGGRCRVADRRSGAWPKAKARSSEAA
jgi:hypothetical protein